MIILINCAFVYITMCYLHCKKEQYSKQLQSIDTNDLEVAIRNENSSKLQLHVYTKRIILDNVHELCTISLNDDCHEILMTNFILITSICLIKQKYISFHICSISLNTDDDLQSFITKTLHGHSGLLV